MAPRGDADALHGVADLAGPAKQPPATVGRRVVLSSLLVACLSAATPAIAGAGRETGLPVPRFVSLAADVANLRLGPRRSDAVIAVYRRRGLPLRVIDEEENWRRVEDFEGDRGWIHTSLLSGRRTALVTGPELLRRAPSSAASAVAEVAPRVIVVLLDCRELWCFVDIERRRGWLPRATLWGAEP